MLEQRWRLRSISRQPRVRAFAVAARSAPVDNAGGRRHSEERQEKEVTHRSEHVVNNSGDVCV
jgi:hypothetical protein